MSARSWLILFLSGVIGCVLSSCATETLRVKKASRSYSRYMIGLLNDRLGNINEAIEYYQKAGDFDQEAPAFNLQLGLDYIRLKKFKEAVLEFEKIVRLSPEDDDARYVLALLYVQLEDYKEAAGQYEKLLEKNLKNRTQNIQLRRILSQLYFLEKDYPAAQRHSEQILEWDPLDESGLYMLAIIYNEEGQVQKAIEAFKAVIEHYPDDADALNSLAYLYAEQNIELDKALSLSEKAVEYDSANGAYLDTLGWIYFKLGETDKALELLVRASKLMVDPVILNHVAEAYYKKGMLEKAKEYWNSSLSFDPAQKEIRTKLKTLQEDVRLKKNP